MKAGDSVQVYICGKKVVVKIFSMDNRYIYFTDPSFKGIKELEKKLYSRSKDPLVDIINPVS
jgi:hypothetical protein